MPVTYILLLANIFMFVLQTLLDPTSNFTNHLLLAHHDLYNRPYTLLTSMFLHSGFRHILFNMYALFWIGLLVQKKIGPQKFLFVYFLSGVLASFVSQYIYPASLGASGAIMGIWGVLIVLMPNIRLLLFFVIPMPIWLAGILFALIDLFGVFHPSGTANVAHLVGLAVGLIYGLYLKYMAKKQQTSNINGEIVVDYINQ